MCIWDITCSHWCTLETLRVVTDVHLRHYVQSLMCIWGITCNHWCTFETVRAITDVHLRHYV